MIYLFVLDDSLTNKRFTTSKEQQTKCCEPLQKLRMSLVFSHLGFWSGNLFLIAPFPDLCLLVPFYGHVKSF